MVRTARPRALQASARWLPTKPVAPVIRQVAVIQTIREREKAAPGRRPGVPLLSWEREGESTRGKSRSRHRGGEDAKPQAAYGSVATRTLVLRRRLRRQRGQGVGSSDRTCAISKVWRHTGQVQE